MIPRVEFLHLCCVGFEIVGGDAAEKMNVVLAVKFRHFARGRGMGFVAFHIFVESVREYQVVCKLEAVRFHWVIGAVVVVPNLRVVKVRDPLFRAHGVFASLSLTYCVRGYKLGKWYARL